jgi:hypothetical protein
VIELELLLVVEAADPGDPGEGVGQERAGEVEGPPAYDVLELPVDPL